MIEINKEIDVICKFLAKEKDPIPVKFQLTKDDGSRSVVSIDEIKSIVHETAWRKPHHHIPLRILPGRPAGEL